jgi:hypothetical protein
MTTASNTLSRRARSLLVAAGVAGAVAFGLVGFEHDASARGLRRAPPAARVEVRTRAPSARHFWVPGYWGHREHVGYVWIGGRWESPRYGWRWVPAHWEHAGPEWWLVEGRWVRW